VLGAPGVALVRAFGGGESLSPLCLGYAYHIGDLSGVAEAFEEALGRDESFGSKGLSESELKEYHYMRLQDPDRS